MSFGAGIGDFIQVTKILTRTVKSIKNAPANFADAAETVTNLDLLFASIKSEVEKPESVFKRDPAQGERFEILTQSCITSLNKLCDILDKYQSLGTNNVKVFDRLRFSKKEVLDVHRELQFRYINLSAFLETLGVGGVGRIEYKVDSLVQQQDRILEAIDKFANVRLETGSVLSNYSNDDKAVWRQLRRDLNTAGFKSSDIEKHKHLIYQKLVELQHCGMLEWHPQEDFDDTKSEMSVVYIGRTRNNYKPPTAETVYEGSDDEGNYTHRNFNPGSIGPLFEDSDEDLLERPGVQRERNNAANERLPSYQDAAPSPRLKIPIPVPQRGPQSAGNSPRTSNQSFTQTAPQFFGTSPRTNAAAFARSPTQFGSSPRHSAEAIPQSMRPPSAGNSGSRSPKYDQELRVGKRSVANIIWRYRRPADIQRPPMQSADLGDGTLPKAASEGRTADVQRLLMQGHNIESIGSRAVPETESFESTTALYRAVRNGHFETAHLLLRYGANANTARKDGKSLMRLLASDGEVELLRLVLEYGATHQKQGALPQAALFGHLSIVQLLLNYGADINEVEKQTALYRASSKGYSDIVDLLLREGADTTFVAPSGPSALYKAVCNGHFRCVRSLLLWGARPDVGCGPDGETALFTACATGHEPTVRLLLSRGARPDDTWFQRYQQPIQRRDGQMEEFFADGPLLAAARGGRLNIAKLLLDYGADVNLRTHFGQTAIDMAYEKGYMQMVDLLHASGARVDQQTLQTMEKQRDAWDRKRDSVDSRSYRDDPRRPRGFSMGTTDLDYEDRRALDVQESRGLQAPSDKRRTKSSSTLRRGETVAKPKSSSTSKLGATAAGVLLLDSLMFLS